MISMIGNNIDMDYLKGPESLYYDRKSAKIDGKDLANEVMAFANANGGVIAVGLMDNGNIEGFNNIGIDKLNELQKVVSTYLRPTPSYECKILPVSNLYGEDDCILLFYVKPSVSFLVRNNKGEVYCRQGDSSIKLTYEQIRNLEYDRRERNFESEIVRDSSIEDIDSEVVAIYKENIHTDLDDISVLEARDFLKEVDGELKFTNAGMLLFGKNPSKYMPWSRVRVFRFEGNDFQVGRSMNIVKEKTFDKNLYRILNEAREFIRSQLREFTYQENNGMFVTHPEYPEFAWFEGLVNAIIHRDYSNIGEQILVKIYNNRMEISSPGGLGGFITVDTMKIKRYSRNPRISRTLVEFGLVKELNEGVKRICREMAEFKLKEPTYIEPDKYSLILILENDIEHRSKVKQFNINEKLRDIWNELSYLEQKAIEFIAMNNGVTREEVSEVIDRSRTTTQDLLNKLIKKEIIVWTGTSKQDGYGKYLMK